MILHFYLNRHLIRAKSIGNYVPNWIPPPPDEATDRKTKAKKHLALLETIRDYWDYLSEVTSSKKERKKLRLK